MLFGAMFNRRAPDHVRRASPGLKNPQSVEIDLLFDGIDALVL